MGVAWSVGGGMGGGKRARRTTHHTHTLSQPPHQMGCGCCSQVLPPEIGATYLSRNQRSRVVIESVKRLCDQREQLRLICKGCGKALGNVWTIKEPTQAWTDTSNNGFKQRLSSNLNKSLKGEHAACANQASIYP